MRTSILICTLAGLAWLAAVVAKPVAAGEFPLKDGDIWVMAGDSITAQHLHSNYFEAFCYARYPKLKFAFRNSGVGGHTIPTTLARFEYDIAAWKPTVLCVASRDTPDLGRAQAVKRAPTKPATSGGYARQPDAG